jgi:hypothetical protein
MVKTCFEERLTIRVRSLLKSPGRLRLVPEYFRARSACGAHRSEIPHITIERTCIYFD